MNKKITIETESLMDMVAERLAAGQKVTLPVKGKSMLPFIVGGTDKVLLEPVKELRRHDIVLAKTANGDYVVHRIVGIRGNELTLMGDGNLAGKERCTDTDVAGKVIAIMRGNRIIQCHSRRQMLLAKCWLALLPCRRYLLYLYHVLRKN